MTTLREAATQALEALETRGEHHPRVYAAITALRAALAEPVQDGKCKHCMDGCLSCDARKLPVQEPVAVVRSVVNRGEDGVNIKWLRGFPQIGTKLYTTSPQRKPLKEEEIDSIWDSEKAFADIYAITRAVERAHEIV